MTAAKSSASSSKSFRRDRFTYSLYTISLSWSWFLYAFGPTTPLIQTELNVSRTQVGLISTMMALGTVCVGLGLSPMILRLGRRTMMISGASLVIAGVVILGLAHSLPLVLLGALVASLGGSTVITAAQPALGAYHHEAGSAAITEVNAAGSGLGLMAPLVVGAMVAAGFGWWPAVALAALIAVAGVFLVRRLPAVPALSGRATRVLDDDLAVDSEPRPVPTRKFTKVFWAFMVALVLASAIESCTTYWVADLLRTQTAASGALATGAVSALVGGMFVSRMVLGPISLRKAPEKLLIVCYAIAFIGWAVFWTATSPVMGILGLAIGGLGYGGHYPLAVSLVLRASNGRPDQAMSKAALFGGLAGATLPFLLGALADRLGTHSAFLVVPVLMAVAVGSLVFALREIGQAARADGHGALAPR